MIFTVSFSCENEAFGGGSDVASVNERNREVARILRTLASECEAGRGPALYSPRTILDLNGNTVGEATMKGTRRPRTTTR